MNGRHTTSILHLAILFGSYSCAFSINVPKFDTHKTKLEREIMGHYEELDDRLVLSSNVRSESSDPHLTMKRAEFARQNQKFNQDDLDELKDLQLVGETHDGWVELVPQKISGIDRQEDKQMKIASVLVGEENADRRQIFAEILLLSKNQQATIAKIRSTFAKLRAEESPPGTWLKTTDGQWFRKPSQKAVKAIPQTGSTRN